MSTLLKSSIAVGLLSVAALAQAVTAGVTVDSSTANVNNPAAAADGVTPANFTDWQTNSAWWNGVAVNPADAVTFKLDKAYRLSSATVTLDWNDLYRFYVSTDGVNFGEQLFSVFGYTDQQVVNSGQVTMSVSFAETAKAYQYVRVQAVFGDGLYSVGEVSFSGSAAPVPEPSALALMLGGMGLVAFVARRRRLR